MTPDLDEIRRALAAATPPWRIVQTGRQQLAVKDAIDDEVMESTWAISTNESLTAEFVDLGHITLVANAPVWLAQCLSEIEALRAEKNVAGADVVGLTPTPDHDLHRPTAITSDDTVAAWTADQLAEMTAWKDQLVAERDAALAECERLRTLKDERTAEWKTALGGRDAWRACADQLADALMHYFSEPPKPALVVYEKLKGADS